MLVNIIHIWGETFKGEIGILWLTYLFGVNLVIFGKKIGT